MVVFFQNVYYGEFPLQILGDSYPSLFPTGRYKYTVFFYENGDRNKCIYNANYIKEVTVANNLQDW